MEITEQQLTEELVISQKDYEDALEHLDGMLTFEKAFDILFAITERMEADKKDYAQKHNGESIPNLTPLHHYCWIARQAFLMGFTHGLDLYNEVVKGFIAVFFGGGTN